MMSLLKMQWTKMNKVFRDMSTYSVVYNLSKSFPSTGHRKYKLTGTFVWIIIKTDFFFFFFHYFLSSFCNGCNTYVLAAGVLSQPGVPYLFSF